MSTGFSRPSASNEPNRHAIPAGAFRFAGHLREQLAHSPPARKSERTRASLEIAAAELLETGGFHQLKISDICARAQCAHGTFYRYWPDGTAVTYQVLSHFLDVIRLRRPRALPNTSLFDRLVAGHRYYVEVYRLNPGLMRCHMQLGDQMASFAEMGDRANLGLARRIVRAFEQEGIPLSGPNTDNQRLSMAMACIGLVDSLLRDIFLHNIDMGMTTEELAHQLSLIWYRAFRACDP